MPMFDRACCCIPKSQIGFVEYIINDMMEAWDGMFSFCYAAMLQIMESNATVFNEKYKYFSAFIDMPEMVGNMSENYMRWKEFNVSTRM